MAKDFRLQEIDETRYYLLEEVKHNDASKVLISNALLD